jgi:putative ABC transport system permease protein
MTVIVAIVILSVILAVQGPAKRIRNMSVVDTISNL